MNPHRVVWNKQQHLLREALADPVNHPEWVDLFLRQHGQLHSKQLTKYEKWSFIDQILDGMDVEALRAVPPNFEHSVAWILWHVARCEDLTMNILLAGTDQVIDRQGWIERLRAPFLHTGNEMDLNGIIQFSQAIDLDCLFAYRSAVGQSTQMHVRQLAPGDLGQKVNRGRMEKLIALGVILNPLILDYWGSRTIAGLLLMPATRHCILHFNEAERIKHALDQ